MSVIEFVKEHPIMTPVIVLSIIATTLIPIFDLSERIDHAVMSEKEFEVETAERLRAHLILQHPTTAQAVEKINKTIEDKAIESKCQWLSSEIRSLEDAIYVRERDDRSEHNDAYVRSLARSLASKKETYIAIECPKVLA